MTPRFRPPACAPSSKLTARFSPSPRKKAIYATSPILPASPIAILPGLPTEKPSPTFPTSPANTRCTCARKMVWAKSAKSISVVPPSFFYGITWSPDSKKIAYTDKWLNLWYVDLDKPTPVKVDTDYFDAQGLRSRMVSRQSLDHVHQAAAQPFPRRLRLFARHGKIHANHRRHERRALRRLRQKREISLLRRQHEFRP